MDVLIWYLKWGIASAIIASLVGYAVPGLLWAVVTSAIIFFGPFTWLYHETKDEQTSTAGLGYLHLILAVVIGGEVGLWVGYALQH